MVITIQGAPHSGKTSLAVKIGHVWQKVTKESVLILFTETYCPELEQVFPGKANLFSLGELLDSGYITEDLVYSKMHVEPSFPNIGFLGYTASSVNSFPTVSSETISEFTDIIQRIFPYIVVDIGNQANPLSNAFTEIADASFNIIAPTYKSAAWYGKNRNIGPKTLVLNMTEKETLASFPPAMMNECVCVLPYSRQIQQEMSLGKINSPLFSRRHTKKLECLLEAMTTNVRKS